MRRAVYLNHASIMTGLGNLDQTWQGLLNQETSIVRREHFPNALLPVTGLSLYKKDLTEARENFTKIIMEDCLVDFPKLPQNTLVIWTGIKNSAEAIESRFYGSNRPRYGSSVEFRSWIIESLGLTNGGMEVNAACASSTVGVALATEYIVSGKYDHVLVAGADVVSPFVYYGFAALKAMKGEVCRPMDVNREGLSLGDGAVALYLSAERQSDLVVSGYGITNDANHITGPSRDGAGLARAMQQALDMSGLEPETVEAFCAHATGTRYNDTMELLAVASLFGEAGLPVFGVKGAIGHTLGAAGGIEVALCGKCLETGLIPPTVGCRNPEAPVVVLEPTSFPGRNILTSNSGFGGVNAAVLMEKMS